ncbi:MAG: adenylate/guanylate cyclase domain-containing protein [Desulfobacterales bacterium]|nr:adenylate/guanylate cyclase domain-containing protein [Desulfobacterales bacterium]
MGHIRSDGQKNKGVRAVLLRGVFWRLLIIEAGLLVLSLAYRWWSEGAGPEALFWYGLRIILLVGIILAFMMVTLRAFLSRKIILPLEAIASANRAFHEDNPGSVQHVFAENAPREIREIIATREQMLQTILDTSRKRLRLVNFIRETFGRYLSQKIVDQILESPEGQKIGGQRKTVTILMSDLRGFTRISEKRDPEEMVRILNRYLGRMSEIIVSWEGIIDEIIGDAILAVFGVPENREDDTYRAVACAIAMQNALVQLNSEMAKEGYPPLETGIGVNTGSVIVGNIGSEVRMKYGVVGSAVNSAARIESNAIGGQVLIGETTYLQTADKLHVKPPQTMMMKGMESPLVFYSVEKIDPPYDLELEADRDAHPGVQIRLPFYFWKFVGKKACADAMSGETHRISDDFMDVCVETRLDVFDDLRIRFEFCVEAHCFEDLYAKVVSGDPGPDPAGGFTFRLAITWIDPKDREILQKWTEDAQIVR